ncbi:DUF58 domain-containing protein [Haloferula sp. A504]|uniref:DUF58 domain-containing protein n=1 Tax=Haloferula sp. A504 TaxID=3373601 RepID=UPI0031C11E7D|nr:DUF58 domain-containing protein [Verrucomicrobiaceae bacterium E54]
MPARVTVDLDHLVLLKAEAHGFSLLSRQPVGSLLAGRHASRLRGRGLAFEEMRHYHPGDDIRTIDWRATARLRSPHVRVYSEERERPVFFVVDQRSPMFFGSRRAMKSVAAAELAALGAWRSLGAGDRVGGIVFNESEMVTLRPNRGPTQALRLFHEIVRLNQRLADGDPPAGQVTLNSVLETAVQQAKHDHLVVVVTDLDGADATTGELVTRLGVHNDVLVAAVYDPLGVRLTGSPGMRAADRGRSWDIPAGGGFEEKFRKAFEDVLEHWRTIFRDLQIPLFPVSTATPVIDQIHELLGARQ